MTQGKEATRETGADVAQLQREPQNPHPPAAMRPASSPVKSALTRARRGLSRKQAGEAGKKSRGTLHPNWGEVSEAAAAIQGQAKREPSLPPN